MDDNNLIYAYLAGFIDADGSISIVTTNYKTKNGLKKQYRVKLSAHNCKIEPIKLLQQKFGGGKLRAKKISKHQNWRPCYEWTLTSTQAINAIKLLKPYLRIKLEQAEICIELHDLKNSINNATKRWNQIAIIKRKN